MTTGLGPHEMLVDGRAGWTMQRINAYVEERVRDQHECARRELSEALGWPVELDRSPLPWITLLQEAARVVRLSRGRR